MRDEIVWKMHNEGLITRAELRSHFGFSSVQPKSEALTYEMPVLGNAEGGYNTTDTGDETD
jgi:hypothetical protein